MWQWGCEGGRWPLSRCDRADGCLTDRSAWTLRGAGARAAARRLATARPLPASEAQPSPGVKLPGCALRRASPHAAARRRRPDPEADAGALAGGAALLAAALRRRPAPARRLMALAAASARALLAALAAWGAAADARLAAACAEELARVYAAVAERQALGRAGRLAPGTGCWEPSGASAGWQGMQGAWRRGR